MNVYYFQCRTIGTLQETLNKVSNFVRITLKNLYLTAHHFVIQGAQGIIRAEKDYRAQRSKGYGHCSRAAKH